MKKKNQSNGLNIEEAQCAYLLKSWIMDFLDLMILSKIAHHGSWLIIAKVSVGSLTEIFFKIYLQSKPVGEHNRD